MLCSYVPAQLVRSEFPRVAVTARVSVQHHARDVMQVWKLFSAMSLLSVGKAPDNWRKTIDAVIFNEVADNIRYDYFCCHTCSQWV